ncbi:MAG: DUF4430 domain-containing protein [Ruminococcus sp.]|nr:DUF4430 domain-containing protein [Ruminococcus sp.]
MRKNKIFAVLLILPLLWLTAVSARAEGTQETYTVAQVQSLRDGIVAYNGAYGAQDFIDGSLCAGAGESAEFYAIALSQSGNYDFSRYESALLSYIDTHAVNSATSREKYALALAAAGSTDSYIADTADEAIGGLGVMSLVFGLHLLNNGYDSALYSADGLVTELLSWQKSDGGWAVMGSYGDVDVTAMTLQALAPYYGRRGDVTDAVDRALMLLSDRQLDSGGFKTMGAENCESAAQVIIALSALGVDAQTDGRFIKDGGSVMNAMLRYSVGDGSFAHIDVSNSNATMQVFCALTAYERYCYGQGPLYLLDHAVHDTPPGNDTDDPQGSPRQGGNDGSGRNTQNNGNNSGGGTKNAGSSAADHATASDTPQTDSSGSRIIVINGQRFIEATDASGEPVTVNISETEAPQAASADASADVTVKPTYGGLQPNATADTRIKSDNPSGGGYKLWAIFAVIGVSGIVCGVLFLLKKRGKKHYIAVGILTAAGILFILLTDFKSADSYRQPAKSDGALTVTVSVRCDTVTGLEKVNDFIPDDGVILDTTVCKADEGDTVYDVLTRAAAENGIPLDNRGARGAAYIAGVNCLYEYDYGELSGWMYRVNGEFPDVGCQSYAVSEGDVIEWLYTTNIGKDLE